jgi:hypothetical protein
MFDDRGSRVDKAGPSYAVQVPKPSLFNVIVKIKRSYVRYFVVKCTD